MADPYQTQSSLTIGEYRLERKLGGGGFGAVYLAEHIYEHTQVAVKILQVPLVKPEDFRGFIKEVGTMTLLRHPHIIPLLYFNVSSEGLPFLVMEYASQGTLRDRHPKDTHVPLATVVQYIEQIASALQYAHDHRIIHRDVKPENMLLRADGTLLLSDFGIAKIMEQSTLMSIQTQIGTPVYMAPEQHLGRPCFASDQYALAVVTYEWISGTRPFQGTSLGLAIQHMQAKPTSLLDLMPTLSASIEQVIFRALSKEPEERFATVQEFAIAFRAAVQDADISRGLAQGSVPMDQGPLKDAITPQPITTTSVHTESEIDTPPAQSPPLDLPVESEPEINTPPFPEAPITDQPSKPNTEINTPSVPQHRPLHDQFIEPDAQIRSSPSQTNNLHSSHQSGTTHIITPSPSVATPKPSKQLAPRRKRNLLLLSGISLVLILSVLLVNLLATNAHTGNHQGPTPIHHITPIARDLNANTASLLAEKWTFPTKVSMESSPAVADGVVYVGSDDNHVYAMDALTGKQKWAFLTQAPVESSPTVVDGVVYVGSNDHNVYAIDAQTGTQKWAFSTKGVVRSSPAVVDGVVYVASNDSNVYAIDAQTGTQKWVFQTNPLAPPPPDPPRPPQPPPAISSPVVANGVVYIGAPNTNVYAIDAASGQQKWVSPIGGFLLSSPAVANGLVYIGSLDQPGFYDKHLYALDAASGLQKWTLPMTGPVLSSPFGPPTQPPPVSSPLVIGETLYIGADNGNVYAINALTGQTIWSFTTQGPVVSSPAVVGGVVYIGSFDGNIYAINAQSGQKIWFSHTGDKVYSSPAVINGMVYVSSLDGKLYAFGLPTPS